MDFKEYTKHVSIVILGILIAFWVNSLGISYKERNNREQILRSILKEQKENRKGVEKSLKEINAMYFILDSVNQKLTKNIKVHYSFVNLKSIGYESLKYSGAMKDMKYSNVSPIVTVYGAHEIIQDLENRMWGEILKLYQRKNHNEIDLGFMMLNLRLLKDNLVSLSESQDELIHSLEQKFN